MKHKILIAVCCALFIFALTGFQAEQERVIVDAREVITEDGIRIEFVAVEAFDNVVDIYLNLEDLVGNRLDGGIYLTPFIGNRSGEIGSSTSPAEIMDRTDDGVVMFHSRHILDRSVEGQDLYFTIERVYHTIEIDLDLAVAIHDAPVLELTNKYDLIFCSRYHVACDCYRRDPFFWGENSYKIDASFEKLRTIGLPVLEPHLHDMELGLESVETIISSIGIIDERLHIQLYDHYPINPSSIYLINSQGEWLTVTLGVGFYNEQGGFYQESIFDIDMDLLSEYRLFGYFTDGGIIELEWTVALEVENNEMHLVADSLYIEYGDYIIREIRLNPFALLLIAESDLPLEVPSPEIRIITENGVVVTAFRGGASRGQGGFIGRSYTDFRLNYDYIDEDFLDLDSVILIEIGGETIEL